MINFNNTYSKLPDRFFERNNPAQFKSPKLLKFNTDLAKELGIETSNLSSDQIARIFSGQDILPNSEPMSLAYAGFQFGHPVPQLGDGRAHLLGEVSGFDIQLKGSGQSRFSRRGDGRSALGPVLREYIVSEAMHFLNIPTTRALCAVATGEQVLRQNGDEPGGVFTRVAKSHIRVGTFQYFAFQDDIEAIEILLNYTIERHFPELAKLQSNEEKSIQLILKLCEIQSDLIAKWSGIGFIHGVMNTDNFSVAGITIDFGPCAFMDHFSFNKVFSSIDQRGRYSFFNQTEIAKWNILRFAECLLPLISTEQNKAVEKIEELLKDNFSQFNLKRSEQFARKLGITDYQSTDEAIVLDFLKYLEKESLDFTLSFRNFSKLMNGDNEGYPVTSELKSVLERLNDRGINLSGLDQVNPVYIPRNHQVEKAISQAYQGDYSHFEKLLEVIKNPFAENNDYKEFKNPPSQDERVYQTFCGT